MSQQEEQCVNYEISSIVELSRENQKISNLIVFSKEDSIQSEQISKSQDELNTSDTQQQSEAMHKSIGILNSRTIKKPEIFALKKQSQQSCNDYARLNKQDEIKEENQNQQQQHHDQNISNITVEKEIINSEPQKIGDVEQKQIYNLANNINKLEAFSLKTKQLQFQNDLTSLKEQDEIKEGRQNEQQQYNEQQNFNPISVKQVNAPTQKPVKVIPKQISGVANGTQMPEVFTLKTKKSQFQKVYARLKEQDEIKEGKNENKYHHQQNTSDSTSFKKINTSGTIKIDVDIHKQNSGVYNKNLDSFNSKTKQLEFCNARMKKKEQNEVKGEKKYKKQLQHEQKDLNTISGKKISSRRKRRLQKIQTKPKQKLDIIQELDNEDFYDILSAKQLLFHQISKLNQKGLKQGLYDLMIFFCTKVLKYMLMIALVASLFYVQIFLYEKENEN